MQTALFLIPLKPGKLSAYKEFSQVITGIKKVEYNDMLKRYSLKNVKVWHRHFDDKDYIMVVHDFDDGAMDKLQRWNKSTHPFDQWFNAQCLNCYDTDNILEIPGQPEFIYDYYTK
jgi:hypothetical protein